jgi:hypothetical protein
MWVMGFRVLRPCSLYEVCSVSLPSPGQGGGHFFFTRNVGNHLQVHTTLQTSRPHLECTYCCSPSSLPSRPQIWNLDNIVHWGWIYSRDISLGSCIYSVSLATRQNAEVGKTRSSEGIIYDHVTRDGVRLMYFIQFCDVASSTKLHSTKSVMPELLWILSKHGQLMRQR